MPKVTPALALSGLSVLVVDDNPVNRRILEGQLTRWQARPACVASGELALKALLAGVEAGAPFKLVLLDANMPGMDGFDVAKAITANSELTGLVIMMLTSSGQFGDASRARGLGISSYLTKPVDAAGLRDAVCRVLEGCADASAGGSDRGAIVEAERGLRILLAEDNIVNQRVAAGLLAKRGHEVSIASNGVEALAALAGTDFDLILMDVQMPEMGGFEATKEIQRSERATGGHVRIVAMTAHAMTGDRERCLAAGMDGYISKPIEPATLFLTVEEEESPRGEPMEAPSMAVGPSADREALMNRVGGDEQLFNEVVELFLVDCPIRLTAIQAAVASGNCEAIRLAAHALKGSASNVSALGLSSAARTLERLGVERRIEAAPAALRNLSAQAVLTIDLLRQWSRRSRRRPKMNASQVEIRVVRHLPGTGCRTSQSRVRS